MIENVYHTAAVKKRTVKFCDHCGTEFLVRNKRHRFCKKTCTSNYGHKFYDYKYQQKSRMRDPKIYLTSLLKKNQRDIYGLTGEKLLEILNKQNGLCAITKEPLTMILGQGKVLTNMSIDKIDPPKGYVEGNVQLVCYIVNVMKNVLSLDELYVWCKKILDGKTN